MITALAWLATTRLGRAAAVAGAAVIGIITIYGKGRRDAHSAAERRKLQDHARTRKRADAALKAARADKRPADKRLQQHGRLRDE